MKIVITGASGLLGSRLFENIAKTEEVVGTSFSKNDNSSYHYLDITDKKVVEAFFEKTKPDAIIHSAALVDVDYCETNQEEAYKTNVEGTKNIVEVSKRYGCKFVYISSDYVFDGTKPEYFEEDELNPINYYGLTKVEGEKIVKNNLKNYIIVRPAIMYGNDEETKKTFVSKIIEKLEKNEKVVVEDEVIKYPTLTDDVAEAIKKLIELDASGIYHLSVDKGISRYEWAKKIARFYNLPEENILIGNTPSKAKRALNININSSKAKQLGIDFTDFDDGLKIFKNQKGCVWRLVYSLRPDMLILNQSASKFRIKCGKLLAKENPADADIVIPVPESGIFGAMGYADESKIPFYFGVIRDYFTNKTFFEPTLQMRNASLDKKLIIVPDVVKDKRIVLIDEAIVSGTTLAIVIQKLKKAGVKEIHVRIPSPPMMYNCQNRKLNQDAFLLSKKFGDSKEEIEEGLRKHFAVDSLKFLSLESFLNIIDLKCEACFECFKNQNRCNRNKMKIIRFNEIPNEQRKGYSIKRLCTEKLNKNPENIGFYETTIPPHSKVKKHIHQNLDEVLLFLTKAKVRVDSEVHSFNPGDIMILPPDSPHEIFAEEEEVKLIAVKLPNIVDDKVEFDK